MLIIINEFKIMQMSTKIRKLAPSHPGAILRELFIKEYALTITEVAD